MESGLTSSQKATFGAAWEILCAHRAVFLSEATGTGKTYIACALIRASMLRHGTRAIVVAPAHLRHVWHEVMSKFCLSASFYSYHAASLGRIPAVESEPALWVFDEAHLLRNRHTLRYASLRRLVGGHRVCLLTATPVSMSWKDLYALVSLCGYPPDLRYREPGVVSSFAWALSPMSRVDRLLTSCDPHVHVREIRYSPETSEGDPSECLERLLSLPWQSIQKDGTLEDAHIVCHVLVQRFLSHRGACLSTLCRIESYFRANRNLRGSGVLTREVFRRLLGVEGRQQLLPFEGGYFGREARMEDRLRIDDMARILAQICARMRVCCGGVDQKVERVSEVIERSGERTQVVVFTQYADTARYFAKHLRVTGKVALLTSGRAEYSGHEISPSIVEAMFDVGGEVPEWWRDMRLERARVLVCSDAYSVGHNFHRASVMIHLDLPWNPMVLRQREGRVLRMGQTARDVEIYTLRLERTSEWLISYEHRLVSRVEGRMGWMEHWSERRHRYDRVVKIPGVCNFPSTWGWYEDRWFPVSPGDVEGLDGQVTRMRLEEAFAPMFRRVRPLLSEEWCRLKCRARWCHHLEAVRRFIDMAWYVAIAPGPMREGWCRMLEDKERDDVAGVGAMGWPEPFEIQALPDRQTWCEVVTDTKKLEVNGVINITE